MKGEASSTSYARSWPRPPGGLLGRLLLPSSRSVFRGNRGIGGLGGRPRRNPRQGGPVFFRFPLACGLVVHAFQRHNRHVEPRWQNPRLSGSLHPEAATQRDETVRVARAVAAGDPRHPVLRPSEIPHLLLRVSLVRSIESIPAPNGLNPSRDGLWLRGGEGGEKNAIILPGEAKTASYMANEALRRAGIRAGETVEWFRLDLDWHEAPLFPTTSHSGGQ